MSNVNGTKLHIMLKDYWKNIFRNFTFGPTITIFFHFQSSQTLQVNQSRESQSQQECKTFNEQNGERYTGAGL